MINANDIRNLADTLNSMDEDAIRNSPGSVVRRKFFLLLKESSLPQGAKDALFIKAEINIGRGLTSEEEGAVEDFLKASIKLFERTFRVMKADFGEDLAEKMVVDSAKSLHLNV